MAKTRRRSNKPQSQQNLLPLLIGGGIALILIVAGLFWLGTQENSPAASSIEVSQFPAKGSPEAPVTIVEFSDYGWPHCRDFVLDTEPLLEAEYIDTGKVRFVVHSFNLGRPETALTAEAAWCAADQDKFFEYQEVVYENFGMPPSQASLTALAGNVGLDSDAFAECLASGTHRADVENARQAAISYGVSSTPTFFINGQKVEGNQPYAVFQRIINQELAAAQ